MHCVSNTARDSKRPNHDEPESVRSPSSADTIRLTTMAIAPHRGMGDLIICNSLFRHFARNHSVVVVPVKPAYFNSATFMLRDVPSVLVIRADTNAEAYHIVNAFRASGPVLFLGNRGSNYRRQEFDRCFYEQADLPFETRWTGFRVIRDSSIELPEPTRPYAFVHDDASRGFAINRSLSCFSGLPECAVVEGVTENIFAWLPCILSAAEIHCIDSAFALLIDSLTLHSSVRLFLHRYARPSDTIPTYHLHWKYLT